MNDEYIIRMVSETCRLLGDMHAYESCTYIAPSYNALLRAAKENHPQDRFLSVLQPIPQTGEVDVSSGNLRGDVEISSGNLRILFAQLRIALESMQAAGSGGAR